MSISTTLLATTIFIFFLLPGFIFLRSFWGSEKGYLQNNNFYNYLIWGTLVSAVIYSISILLFNLIAFWLDFSPISIEGFCKKIIDHSIDSDGKPLAPPSKNISPLLLDIYRILILTIIADIFAFIFGRGIRKLIMKFEFDLKFPILQFKNEWYYILSGRGYTLDKTLFPNGYYVEIDFLCEVGSSVVIYKGMMANYKLKDESLEYIYLTWVRRTGITEWEANTSLTSTSPSFPSFPSAPVIGTSANITGNLTAKSLEATGDIVVSGDIKISESITVGGSISSGGSITAGNMKITGANNTAHQGGSKNPGSKTLFDVNMNPDFYPLPGNTMTFKAEEIKNIHVSYKPFPS